MPKIEDVDVLLQSAIEQSWQDQRTSDRIVLISSEGDHFAISKLALLRESGFFRDMFSLPQIVTLDDEGIPMTPDPLDIFVGTQSIALLQKAMANYSKRAGQLQGARSVSDHIIRLSLLDQAHLYVVADRFDCERNCRDIMAIIDQAAKSSPTDLLRRSSKANVVWIAKLAIAELDRRPGWDDSVIANRYTVDNWWEAISTLRPSWQLGLTKLKWEGTMQLVERPTEIKRRRPNGKAYPRTRERIMIETKLSWVEIADRFDPEEYDN